MKKTKFEEVDESQTDKDNFKQAKVIAKLKQALNILESVQIKNEDSVDILDKPVDELLSFLKYLPTEKHFSILPIEIRTDILSHLCHNGSFVAASVCQEWRDILAPKIVNLSEVSIGKRCSNKYTCEDGACFMPQEVLKAAIVTKMDVILAIRHPVPHVDTNLLVQGFKSVSKIMISGWCKDESYGVGSTLTNVQIEHLFVGLEQHFENITVLNLERVDMTHLDQNRLINCLLKVKVLRLRESSTYKVVDVQMLIQKLLQVSNPKLKTLALGYLNFPADQSEDMANALCKIERIQLGYSFPRNRDVVVIKQLMANILSQNIAMKQLTILTKHEWSQLISSEDLKTMISNMEALYLIGRFSSEQIGEATSLPGIETKKFAFGHKIYKNTNKLLWI